MTTYFADGSLRSPATISWTVLPAVTSGSDRARSFTLHAVQPWVTIDWTPCEKSCKNGKVGISTLSTPALAPESAIIQFASSFAFSCAKSTPTRLTGTVLVVGFAPMYDG